MKRSHLREVTIEITVGVVMFMILLLLGSFTIILSRENLFAKKYPLTVFFADVAGLNDGDNVLYHGVKIGVVKELEIIANGVNVKAMLQRDVPIHEDYRIQIVMSSVLGGHFLELNEGTPDAPVLPAGAPLQGTPSADIIGDIGETVGMIKNALGRGKILENLEATMEEFKQITTKINQGEGTLGRLITDDDIYLMITDIATNLQVVSAGLAQGKGTLGKLLTDDQVYNDVAQITRDLKQVSADLAQGKGTLGKLVQDDALYVQIQGISSNVNIVTERLVKGEGTLGKLSAESGLYDDIEDLVNEGRATLDDIRTSSPIVSFSSVFFGAF